MEARGLGWSEQLSSHGITYLPRARGKWLRVSYHLKLFRFNSFTVANFFEKVMIVKEFIECNLDGKIITLNMKSSNEYANST